MLIHNLFNAVFLTSLRACIINAPADIMTHSVICIFLHYLEITLDAAQGNGGRQVLVDALLSILITVVFQIRLY